MADDRFIGTRFEETLDRVRALVDQRDVWNDTELDFLLSLKDKLCLYRDRTFVSVAQLNWLTRLEQDPKLPKWK